MSSENIPFESLMHDPTLHSKPELTDNDEVILDNLMLEQEDARVARGLESTSTNMVEDDYIIMPT